MAHTRQSHPHWKEGGEVENEKGKEPLDYRQLPVNATNWLNIQIIDLKYILINSLAASFLIEYRIGYS